jgi:hypothetical protein
MLSLLVIFVALWRASSLVFLCYLPSNRLISSDFRPLTGSLCFLSLFFSCCTDSLVKLDCSLLASSLVSAYASFCTTIDSTWGTASVSEAIRRNEGFILTICLVSWSLKNTKHFDTFVTVPIFPRSLCFLF